jgi:hypothetical protein
MSKGLLTLAFGSIFLLLALSQSNSRECAIFPESSYSLIQLSLAFGSDWGAHVETHAFVVRSLDDIIMSLRNSTLSDLATRVAYASSVLNQWRTHRFNGSSEQQSLSATGGILHKLLDLEMRGVWMFVQGTPAEIRSSVTEFLFGARSLIAANTSDPATTAPVQALSTFPLTLFTKGSRILVHENLIILSAWLAETGWFERVDRSDISGIVYNAAVGIPSSDFCGSLITLRNKSIDSTRINIEKTSKLENNNFVFLNPCYQNFLRSLNRFPSLANGVRSGS